MTTLMTETFLLYLTLSITDTPGILRDVASVIPYNKRFICFAVVRYGG